jgi:hypothetical protein
MHDLGYKVCYKIQGSNKWKVYLVTNTFSLAEWHVRWYERDPPKHLKFVVWDVFPILKLREYKVRWRGCPF